MPLASDEEAAEEGPDEPEEERINTDLSKHATPSHPWCRRKKTVILILAATLLIIVGVVLGVVLTRNGAHGDGKTASSAAGDVTVGSAGGKSPPSSSREDFGPEEAEASPGAPEAAASGGDGGGPESSESATGAPGDAGGTSDKWTTTTTSPERTPASTELASDAEGVPKDVGGTYGETMDIAPGGKPASDADEALGDGGGASGETVDAAPEGKPASTEGASDERPAPSPGTPPVQSGQLTAADIDDNLNFDDFLAYKQRMQGSMGQQRQYYQLPNPDLSGRITISVVDETGAPFSSAHIESDFQQAAASGGGNNSMGISTSLIAGTNGKLHLFPALDGVSDTPQFRAKAPGGVCPDQCSEFTAVSGTENSVVLKIPGRRSSLPSQMDLALVIDTTGSMCDELRYLQSELREVLSQVTEASAQNVDIRVALVAYKDRGDRYVVSIAPFSTPDNTIASLMKHSCGGGGDYPEAMDEALEAAAALEWREGNVARVVFLVADAPPHDEKLQAAFDAALRLRRLGAKVYGLAASGVADAAEYEMRLMGVITGARYMWLTDDSGIGNPHAVPKVVCYQVTRLDHLLVRVLRSELKGERVEAKKEEIVREVGAQQDGICLNSQSSLCEKCAATLPPTKEVGPEEEVPGVLEIQPAKEGGLSTGAIVGIAVGGIVFLSLLLSLYVLRKPDAGTSKVGVGGTADQKTPQSANPSVLCVQAEEVDVPVIIATPLSISPPSSPSAQPMAMKEPKPDL